ncbi:MAG: nuclear transport factor 2 family protein [Candidatus Rokubacteria bacterium]|nr:nuclear transport factor 2 family protein [Candidatus Rokubacteria bacterium]
MSIVRAFTDAFNRADVDAVVACFTPDASYADGFFGVHRGTDELRAMFARMFREGRDYVWQLDELVEAGDRAATEWTFSYVVTDAVPRSAGREIRFRGMSLFELGNGKIRAYREQFDVGQACLQLGFSPEAITKVLRRRLELDH